MVCLVDETTWCWNSTKVFFVRFVENVSPNIPLIKVIFSTKSCLKKVLHVERLNKYAVDVPSSGIQFIYENAYLSWNVWIRSPSICMKVLFFAKRKVFWCPLSSKAISDPPPSWFATGSSGGTIDIAGEVVVVVCNSVIKGSFVVVCRCVGSVSMGNKFQSYYKMWYCLEKLCCQCMLIPIKYQ